MYNHTTHLGIKHFCCYSLQALSTEKILKFNVKDCFKINSKQMIKMPENVNMLDSKTMKGI